MAIKKIDLSDIIENDLDKTSSFTDLMSKKRKKKNNNIESIVKEKETCDIEDMIKEKKKSQAELNRELEKAKEQYNIEIKKENDESLGKTQILELTRAMKFNFEEKKEENNKKKIKIISPLNIIGEVNLLCIGYYIYLLIFTSYQDDQTNYLITGCIIVSLVLLFGLSVVTNKKLSKLFNVLNILAIIAFIGFNIYTLSQIKI